MTLAQEWDKTFPQATRSLTRRSHSTASYGFHPAWLTSQAQGDMPGRLRGHRDLEPFGAVKEQASGFYAETMAGGAS